MNVLCWSCEEIQLTFFAAVRSRTCYTLCKTRKISQVLDAVYCLFKCCQDQDEANIHNKAHQIWSGQSIYEANDPNFTVNKIVGHLDICVLLILPACISFQFSTRDGTTMIDLGKCMERRLVQEMSRLHSFLTGIK